MKKKRKPGRKRLILKPLIYFFLAAASLLAIPVCFYASMIFYVIYGNNDHWSVVLRKPASYSKVSEDRWERYPEAKIEFDNLKQILLGVVDNTEIEPQSTSFFVDIYQAPHCIIGSSHDKVGAEIPFEEVIQQYNTWATVNEWRYEEIKFVNEHSGEIQAWYFVYKDPNNTTATQTWLRIELLSADQSSAIFQSTHPTHYKFLLSYVDHSCDGD